VVDKTTTNKAANEANETRPETGGDLVRKRQGKRTNKRLKQKSLFGLCDNWSLGWACVAMTASHGVSMLPVS
jgi:hypothetical protein